jgi:hypothetical protein
LKNRNPRLPSYRHGLDMKGTIYIVRPIIANNAQAAWCMRLPSVMVFIAWHEYPIMSKPQLNLLNLQEKCAHLLAFDVSSTLFHSLSFPLCRSAGPGGLDDTDFGRTARAGRARAQSCTTSGRPRELNPRRMAAPRRYGRAPPAPARRRRLAMAL